MQNCRIQNLLASCVANTNVYFAAHHQSDIEDFTDLKSSATKDLNRNAVPATCDQQAIFQKGKERYVERRAFYTKPGG